MLLLHTPVFIWPLPNCLMVSKRALHSPDLISWQNFGFFFLQTRKESSCVRVCVCVCLPVHLSVSDRRETTKDKMSEGGVSTRDDSFWLKMDCQTEFLISRGLCFSGIFVRSSLWKAKQVLCCCRDEALRQADQNQTMFHSFGEHFMNLKLSVTL